MYNKNDYFKLLNKKVNLAVVDCSPLKNKTWADFTNALVKETGMEWDLFGEDILNATFHSKKRYIHWIKFSWNLFVNRKKISHLMAIQQFYGLLLAFYCRFFHVKKTTNIVILSFIYNSKNGLFGKIYKQLISYIVSSKYIDKLLVHSREEVEYYSKLFKIDKKKLEFCLLGIADEANEYKRVKSNETKDIFVLSVGNSNRDFEFIEESLVGMPYKVKLYSSTLVPHINQNIVFSKGIPLREYYEELANCFCMVITLKNDNISSGQLVLLQSYAFGKPVIITSTKGCEDYIRNSCAITITKKKEELQSAIKLLIDDKKKYNTLSKNAIEIFRREFSHNAMAKCVAHIILELNGHITMDDNTNNIRENDISIKEGRHC